MFDVYPRVRKMDFLLFPQTMNHGIQNSIDVSFPFTFSFSSCSVRFSAVQDFTEALQGPPRIGLQVSIKSHMYVCMGHTLYTSSPIDAQPVVLVGIGTLLV